MAKKKVQVQGVRSLRNEAYECPLSDEGCSATQKLNFLRSHQNTLESLSTDNSFTTGRYRVCAQ